METYKNLNVFRYEDSEESVRNANKNGKPSIFLAGPTVRGNQPHLTSWRYDAIEIFKELNFNGSLIVPEFTSKTESDKGKNWVPMWEYNGLKSCDTILFWIPRTRELIGLTTNWEQGYWMGKNIAKCVYGRPDESFRNNYNDLMWKQIIKEYNEINNNKLVDIIYKTLYNTINKAIYNCTPETIIFIKWLNNNKWEYSNEHSCYHIKKQIYRTVDDLYKLYLQQK